jgi:hypothetical protein
MKTPRCDAQINVIIYRYGPSFGADDLTKTQPDWQTGKVGKRRTTIHIGADHFS